MAYTSFKPVIWSKYIQHELEKITVLQEHCNTRFQGEAGLGKTVKIIGVGRPNVGTYVPGSDIDSAETPPDNSMQLLIDQYKYTHFIVDDVDEAQAIPELMQAYMQESTAALAQARDSYIASLAADATQITASLGIKTPADARAEVEKALVALWENGVGPGDGIVINVTPWYYALLKNAVTSEITANEDMLKKGMLGTFNGAAVKMSNNLYSAEGDDYIMVRTKNAIAFASGVEKTEAYRPDRQFADAVKVLDCYGAKLVRPKELYVIKCHKDLV